MFLNTPALRNPVLATIAMNPLLTKKIFSRIVLDPADVTAERVNISQQPLVLQNATNTFGEWLNYAVTVEEESLTSDPANYATLTMPTLINWGVNDTIIPLSEGEYLHSILPNSEMFLMDDINHISYVENNKEFVQMMLEFLQKQSSAVN
jgi:pimeloyl-ACP methyl ester carboxylesterase